MIIHGLLVQIFTSNVDGLFDIRNDPRNFIIIFVLCEVLKILCDIFGGRRGDRRPPCPDYQRIKDIAFIQFFSAVDLFNFQRTRGSAWYNITVRFNYPKSHLIPFAPHWAEDASKNLSVEGELTLLFTKIALFVQFILGEVGDVSFFTSQSCVRVSTMQLKKIIRCKIVDPSTAFNTIVPQYKRAVGLFNILLTDSFMSPIYSSTLFAQGVFSSKTRRVVPIYEQNFRTACDF